MTTRRTIVGTAIAAPFLARRAWAQAPIELKLSHYNPPGSVHHKYLTGWAETIAKRSDGRMTVRIYPAAQLGPVPRQFDLARNGQADIAMGLMGATPGRYPISDLASLPFVFPSAGSASVVTSRRMTELAPQYLAPEFTGLRTLWFVVSPPVSLHTARREVAGPGDAKGLKIRFQGEQNAKTLRALGAVPLQIPPGEVADGMAKGVIDGAIFNAEAAESFGTLQVTRFVSEPGFSTATLGLAMNPARYASLPPDLQKLIDDTTGPDAAAALGTMWDAAEAHGRDALLAARVKLVPMAADEGREVQGPGRPHRGRDGDGAGPDGQTRQGVRGGLRGLIAAPVTPPRTICRRSIRSAAAGWAACRSWRTAC